MKTYTLTRKDSKGNEIHVASTFAKSKKIAKERMRYFSELYPCSTLSSK